MKDAYIGFDIDSRKTVPCVVQAGREDWHTTVAADLQRMHRHPDHQWQGMAALRSAALS